VTDSRNRRDGRYIERLGYYNPIASGNDKRLHLNQARVQYWLGNGAQASDRVASLIKEYRKLPAEQQQTEPVTAMQVAAEQTVTSQPEQQTEAGSDTVSEQTESSSEPASSEQSEPSSETASEQAEQSSETVPASSQDDTPGS
jgi:small subunit ribosomal protein S16